MGEKPTFSMVEVEPGRKLHYLVEGPEDGPIVLYDAGAFGIYADGWWVKEDLKDRFRVVLYDRAGMGHSDPVPVGQAPSPDWHVADMRRLLTALGISKPVILVGHSMSGLRMHTFANLYRGDLRGLVFVDALNPRLLKDQLNRFMHERFQDMLKITAYGARAGLAEPVSKILPNMFKLEGPPRDDKVAAYASQRHIEASRDETLALDFDADYLHGDGAYHVPVAVFACTLINGMQKDDADRAKANTGYGWYGKFPKEDHVSILTGVYAEAIARRVAEIDAHAAEAH